MLLFVAFCMSHALGGVDFGPHAAAPRVSLPSRVTQVPIRFSMPSDALRGAASLHAADVPAGFIGVPANARGPQPEPEYADFAYADDQVLENVVYGPHGGSYSTPRYSRRVPHAGVRGSRPIRPVISDGSTGEVYSPFSDTADDAHRRAQLQFHAASYPRLGQFEEANRRAQLEFYRSTISPAARQSQDGLRRERNSLEGPALRRDNTPRAR
mgnify:CR=1 FL=1